MTYIYKLKDNYVLKENYHEANFSSLLNGKKRLPYKKFFIYKEAEIVHVTNPNKESIHILEIHDNNFRVKGTILVIYIDPRDRLSFIITKRHNRLSLEEVIEKADSSPAQRLFSFTTLKNHYLFGVIRFRYTNMQSVQISLGYDKTLTYEHTYLFPKNIRRLLSEKTNKLLLLTQIGYTRISKKELLNKYMESSEINLPLYIRTQNKSGSSYYYPAKLDYREKYNKKNYIYSSASHKLNNNIEYFMRKSVSGQLVLVITDRLSKFVKLKERIGKIISLFGKKEKYDVYFEKFCKNAGESAFELFKEGMKNNDKNSKYILDSSNEKFKEIQKEYGKNNVLAHNSIKSFKTIFQARSFVSSDLVTHLQRRLYDNSQLIKRKILSNNKKIFLQHGPSLATNVFERGYFNKRVPICPDYMVTNSNIETSYFIKYPQFHREQIIQMGIPNLDLYVKRKEEKKEEITFMLTWRPWDLTGKVETNSYIDRYLQFLKLISEEKFYNDKKINVILHPKARLMLENQFPETYTKLKKYLYEDDIKEALIKSKVVITDYSSICFYAFAGGSNIIYFWGDKEKAENEYGAPNILQSHNRFGDVSMDITNELDMLIKSNYISEQNQLYLDNYQELVSYTEGNNTQNVYNKIKEL